MAPDVLGLALWLYKLSFAEVVCPRLATRILLWEWINLSNHTTPSHQMSPCEALMASGIVRDSSTCPERSSPPEIPSESAENQAVRFPDLRAEYSLTTPLARNSLLELRKMFRASKPDEPMPLCLPLLEPPILQTVNTRLSPVTHSSTERYIFGHLLISVESFLVSLSLLEGLWNFTENCPSIPALFCDAILRRDPYRDSHELDIARGIMEHIDTHHASISHEVNVELGSSHIVDPLPEISDNRCRCPLQYLNMPNVPKNSLDALVSEAYIRLTEVERFIASHRLIDPFTAAKYFHTFEHRIVQIVHHSKSFNTNGILTQHGPCSFIPPRARQIRPSRINGIWPKL